MVSIILNNTCSLAVRLPFEKYLKQYTIPDIGVIINIRYNIVSQLRNQRHKIQFGKTIHLNKSLTFKLEYCIFATIMPKS